MLSLIGSRKDKESVQRLLDVIRSDANGFISSADAMAIDSGHPEDVAREIFLQCLMYHGSKSFSHLLSIVERQVPYVRHKTYNVRYLPLIQDFNSLPQNKLHTIKVTASFWARNTQFLEIILDKYMNYRVLDPASIISWVLSPAVLEEHHTECVA